MGTKLGEDDIGDRLNIDDAVGGGHSSECRARLLDGKFERLPAGDTADRRIGRC
jgi:hypothetical protein